MTIQEAEKFVNSLRWQYAKNYPQCPQEYTCLAWKPEIQQKLIDFANLIQREGYTEKWSGRESKALNIGEMKYWTMDFPIEKTDLLNRAYFDENLRAQIAEFVQSENFVFKQGMSLGEVREQMADFNFKERITDCEFVVPEREKIACYTCAYADRNPIKGKDGEIIVEDRIDYGDCAQYESKPNDVLFPDRKTGKYGVCPKYEKF